MSEIKKETTGEITILLSNVFFALTAILVKILPGTFSGAYVSFFRFGFGIILITLSILATKGTFKIYGVKTFIFRGLCGAFAMVLYFTAIRYTSSGRATLLTNTFPVFVALFGFFFFKEKIYLNNILSIIFCLIGVVFVFYDGSNYPFFGDLLGIIGAVFAGLAVHFLKKLREKNSPLIVYLAVCTFGLLMSSFSVKESSMLNLPALAILIAIGLSTFFAQIFMAHGFKYVSSTKGSIITFFKIPLTIFFSLFIGEEIKIRFVIGTILIIIGLIINRK